MAGEVFGRAEQPFGFASLHVRPYEPCHPLRIGPEGPGRDDWIFRVAVDVCYGYEGDVNAVSQRLPSGYAGGGFEQGLPFVLDDAERRPVRKEGLTGHLLANTALDVRPDQQRNG